MKWLNKVYFSRRPIFCKTCEIPTILADVGKIVISRQVKKQGPGESLTWIEICIIPVQSEYKYHFGIFLKILVKFFFRRYRLKILILILWSNDRRKSLHPLGNVQSKRHYFSAFSKFKLILRFFFLTNLSTKISILAIVPNLPACQNRRNRWAFGMV